MLWLDKFGLCHQSTNPYLALCCCVCDMMTLATEETEPKCPICFVQKSKTENSGAGGGAND
jgi:hypothetical protein